MSPVPPKIIHQVDQDRAALHELVGAVDQHVADGCAYPQACAGPRALAIVRRFDAHDRHLARTTPPSPRLSTAGRILLLAATELAEHDREDDPAEADPRPTAHERTARAVIDALLDTHRDNPLARPLLAVAGLHVAKVPSGPDPDCVCEGAGAYFEPELGRTVHCCCGCAWCVACGGPVCGGPCDTLSAIAGGLGIARPEAS